MFRRTSKVDDQPFAVEPRGPGAKGRPTPTRKEAEAARRERAKVGLSGKGTSKQTREQRSQANARTREGMRSGDERFLPARDKGPLKRFIRDYVDGRISIAEFLLPLLILIMVLQYSGSSRLQSFGGALWTTTLLVVALDTVWLVVRLRRALKAEFPEESLKGTTLYVLLRVLQMRWLRMPKPRVKIGGAPR